MTRSTPVLNPPVRTVGHQGRQGHQGRPLRRVRVCASSPLKKLRRHANAVSAVNQARWQRRPQALPVPGPHRRAQQVRPRRQPSPSGLTGAPKMSNVPACDLFPLKVTLVVHLTVAPPPSPLHQLAAAAQPNFPTGPNRRPVRYPRLLPLAEITTGGLPGHRVRDGATSMNAGMTPM